MNEIQKENALVMSEYWKKVAEGLNPKLEAEANFSPAGWIDIDGGDIHLARIRIAQEMVEHKGGHYPKPVELKDAVVGRDYYVSDVTNPKKFNRYTYIAGLRSDYLFSLGLVHWTKEDAIAHTNVMLGLADKSSKLKVICPKCHKKREEREVVNRSRMGPLYDWERGEVWKAAIRGLYPKPVALEDAVVGRKYYACAPHQLVKYCDFTHTGTKNARMIFERGQVHETPEAAIKQTDVMLGIN